MSVIMERWAGPESPEPVRMEESYKGATLAERERNFHDDSDFYAVVWDEAEQRVRNIEYATTRFGGTDRNRAFADATDEVKAKARVYLAKWMLELLRSENDHQCRCVKPGRRVRIVAGRKIPLGVTGTVGWVETCNYGRSRWSAYQAATFDSDPDPVTGERTRHYGVNIGNLEVIEPETYLRPDAELQERADQWSRNDCWHAQAYLHPGMVVV